MRTLYTCIVSGILTILAPVSFAHQSSAHQSTSATSDSDQFHCDDPRTQIDMNVCSGDTYQSHVSEMNSLYKEQMAYLGGSAKEELREAQTAWAAYRDKSCLYESGKDPRSYMELINLSCLSRITEDRIATLKTYLACRENGCPYN